MTGHAHLDLVGGISGDMFAASMLSAFPGTRDQLERDLSDANLTDWVTLRVCEVRKSGFAATQVGFEITPGAPPTRHWKDIRARLQGSALRPAVRAAAIDIFSGLAEAEAASHGIPVDKVHFHEIADWDSMADMVAAASLIVSTKIASWSCSDLPLGRGRVQTQHGLIPVPAPATAHLLTGFRFADDGGEGERITPTGAAILRHLLPSQDGRQAGLKLSGIGTGAGQRDMKGIPNLCRLMYFETASAAADLVGSLAFEIDDMTAEELAAALERIQTSRGVLDAGYTTGYGKQSRSRHTVTVLVEPARTDEIVDLCLRETSTIGVRIGSVRRRVLRCEPGLGGGLRAPAVDRPGGATAKVARDEPVGVGGDE
ncbi:LarC family nickel insertion protein [Pseudooceanicola sp.]|uniref:LarC family nickel insertion protein n=1 Tax=Pseudooceanicola sp. TaxID=1914328 RepID=UPI0035161A04